MLLIHKIIVYPHIAIHSDTSMSNTFFLLFKLKKKGSVAFLVQKYDQQDYIKDVCY